AAGALQVLLPELAVPDRPLYAIYGPGRDTPRKVSVFLDFLADWFSRHPITAVRP
ncbi:LysR family transcriptional regulator, partial [Streptomyces sp. TRM76130]|nr:LysR family transcriptional regulator [Streptomyces sp. TRM76130]